MSEIIIICGEKFKDLKTIAEEVRCSYYTLLNWIKNGKVVKSKIRKIGNKWFLRAEDRDIREYKILYYTRLKDLKDWKEAEKPQKNKGEER